VAIHVGWVVFVSCRNILYYMGQPYPNSFNNLIEIKSLNPNMVDLLSGMTRHNPRNTFDT